MLTKVLAIITVLVALVAATALTQPANPEGSKASISAETPAVDCEYLVTPQGTTKTKGGENC